MSFAESPEERASEFSLFICCISLHIEFGEMSFTFDRIHIHRKSIDAQIRGRQLSLFVIIAHANACINTFQIAQYIFR